MAFFEVTVAGDDFVVVGDADAVSGGLRYNEEIVVFADDGFADERSGEDISDIVCYFEEPFRIFQINHNNRQFHTSVIDIFNSIPQNSWKVVLVEIDLIVAAAVHEDNHLSGGFSVFVGVGLQTVENDSRHGLVLLVDLVGWNAFCVGDVAGEGLVHCSAGCDQDLLVVYGLIDANEHHVFQDVFDLSLARRSP